MGISTTLYRALHRALRQLQQANSGSDLQVRLPVDLCNTKWGSYRTVASTDVFVQETRDYLGALASDLEPAVVRPEPPKSVANYAVSEPHVRALLRDKFRSAAALPQDRRQQALNQGFLALRMLTQQLDLADCNSVGEGHDVRVEMSSTFVKRCRPCGDQLVPKYRFLYRARVHNMGTEAVKLRDPGRLGTCGHLRQEDILQTWNGPEAGATPPRLFPFHPIIRPGEVFEYVARMQPSTPRALLPGRFNLHIVLEPDKMLDGELTRTVSRKHEAVFCVEVPCWLKADDSALHDGQDGGQVQRWEHQDSESDEEPWIPAGTVIPRESSALSLSQLFGEDALISSEDDADASWEDEASASCEDEAPPSWVDGIIDPDWVLDDVDYPFWAGVSRRDEGDLLEASGIFDGPAAQLEMTAPLYKLIGPDQDLLKIHPEFLQTWARWYMRCMVRPPGEDGSDSNLSE